MNLLYRHQFYTIKLVDHHATGSQVRQERRKRNLTLQVVSAAAGISVVYLSNLERGKRRWTEELLKRIEIAMENLS